MKQLKCCYLVRIARYELPKIVLTVLGLGLISLGLITMMNFLGTVQLRLFATRLPLFAGGCKI